MVSEDRAAQTGRLIPLHVVVSTGVTLALAAALVAVAVRLYQREQILFGR